MDVEEMRGKRYGWERKSMKRREEKKDIGTREI